MFSGAGNDIPARPSVSRSVSPATGEIGPGGQPNGTEKRRAPVVRTRFGVRPSWSCRQLLRVVVAIRCKHTRAFTCDPNNSVLFSRRKKRSERGMLNAAISPIRNQNPRFAGYAGSPPDPRWPGEARVAVSIVVNFEEGAEFSVTDGDPENEAVYEIEQRLAGRSDPAIDSHFEYGSRAGWWRIMEVLDRGLPDPVRSGQAAFRMPSCWSAVTPSSRPISSAILPFSTRSTVVPVNCIFRPDAAGSEPTRKSLNAGPV